MFKNWPAVLLCFCFLPMNMGVAADKTLSRPKSYEAISDLTDQLAADLPKIKEQVRSFTMTQYSQSENYPGNMRDYVMHRIETSVKVQSENKLNFVRCVGCMAPRAISDGKDIFIRKGFVDNEELKDTLARLNVGAYMVVNLGNSEDEAIMQVSLYKVEGQQLVFSKEYKTALQGADRTGVIFGIGGESVMFHDNSYPSLVGARLALSQRLVGLGDVGIYVMSFAKKEGFPQMMSFGGVAEFNKDEMSGKRGKYVSWIFPVEFGVTDFNGDMQLHLGGGFKIRFGSVLYLSIKEHLHTFVSKPKHDGTVNLDPNANPGDPVAEKDAFASDKPIPAFLSIGFGADF